MEFPVSSSDLHQIADVAKTQQKQNGMASKAKAKDHLFCRLICFGFGYAIALLSLIFLAPSIIHLYFPELPSVSLESMSFTVINIASDTQVTSNLEAVFRMENNYVYNNVTHYHVNALAFHITKIVMGSFLGHFDIVEEKQLIANATVAPFEQYGKDYKRFHARMDGVVVDVDDYQQHINGRYGVSYLKFGLMGFISAEGGGKPLKRTSSLRAMCDGEFKVVFSWNGTTKLDVQPPMECQVHGQWRTLYNRLGYVAVPLIVLFQLIYLLCLLLCKEIR